MSGRLRKSDLNVFKHLKSAILKSPDKLFADETRCPVLDPGRGKTKSGYFWAIASDDRPWGSKAPPAVAYSYAPGRGGKNVHTLLEGFNGILQVDGYDGYNILARPDRGGGPVTLAYCWAFAKSPPKVRLPSPKRLWSAFRNCTRSRQRSADSRRRSGLPPARPGPGLKSRS